MMDGLGGQGYSGSSPWGTSACGLEPRFILMNNSSLLSSPSQGVSDVARAFDSAPPCSPPPGAGTFEDLGGFAFGGIGGRGGAGVECERVDWLSSSGVEARAIGGKRGAALVSSCG